MSMSRHFNRAEDLELVRRYQRLTAAWISTLPCLPIAMDSLSVLDVGASEGYMWKALGARRYLGVEPDLPQDSVQQPRQCLQDVARGVPPVSSGGESGEGPQNAAERDHVRRGTLASAVDPGEMFDLVLYCHVLEHVPDPVGEVRLAASHLRPAGVLAVAIPAADSPWAWEMGSHLSMVNEAMLGRWMNLAGLSVAESMRVEFRPGKVEIWMAAVKAAGVF